MLIGKAIYTILNADATLGALVNGIGQNQVAQSTAFPYIVYHVISGTNNTTKDGVNKADVERWQINIYAEDDDTANTINERVRTLLDGYSFTTVAGIQVEGIQYLTHIVFYNDEHDVYHIAVDYQIRVTK